MRLALLLALATITGSHAWAQDARVTSLDKQLKSAKDPRARAQAATLLGQTGSEVAVAPLCKALKDVDPLVRTAAATSLGDLRLPSALACLKATPAEPDPAVRQATERALAQTPIAPGGLYVNVEPVQDRVGGLPDSVTRLAERLLHEKLASLGAAFAPANEPKKGAQTLIKARHLKGYQLRLQFMPVASGMKVEMLIMTYPDQALKGSWNVKASGGQPEALINAMIPQVVDDAAVDLEWTH